MNVADDAIPDTGVSTGTGPPGDRRVANVAEQAPLGAQPGYDDLLDTAVDYTFPCSDPIAVGGCCALPLKGN